MAEPTTRGGGLEIRRLEPGGEAAVGALLARAFAEDPIFVWIEPEPGARLAFLGRFMSALTRRSLLYAEVWRTAPELAGVSLWKGPDLRGLSPGQLAATGLDRIGEWLSAPALSRFEALFDPVEAALEEDVPGPRWYLGVLGVAPERQGEGLGSRLMRPILERADREGLPVTLETGQPRNLPLYRRHGFAVLREIPPPEPGGPVAWTLLRPPGTGRQPAG